MIISIELGSSVILFLRKTFLSDYPIHIPLCQQEKKQLHIPPPSLQAMLQGHF